VPVGGGTGGAVVSPAASTLRDEMAVSGQSLLAASGQNSDGRPHREALADDADDESSAAINT
jgi:hypothetical protein